MSILAAWTATDPLYWKVEVDALDSFGRVIESHGHCVTGSTGLGFLFGLLGLNIVLLLYGNVLVYQARSVPTRYNEGKYISFCVANNLQTTLFAVLLAVFVYDTPVAFFIIKWSARWPSRLRTCLSPHLKGRVTPFLSSAQWRCLRATRGRSC